MSEEKEKEHSVEEETLQKQEGVDPKEEKKEEKDVEEKKGGARRASTHTRKNVQKMNRFTRPKPEFEQKIINISRVTRVVKGGRRLSFRVDMVIGDKKGRVGLGSGKATDTSLAIQKAYRKAKKNLLYLKLTKTNSLPYDVKAKVTSTYLEIMPNKGRGLVAGSTVRNVLQLAGITDVTAKIRSRSKNKLNNAKAAIKALREFEMSNKEKEEKKAKLLSVRQKNMRNIRFRKVRQGEVKRKRRITNKNNKRGVKAPKKS